MLIGQSAFAETMREKRIRQEMIDRVTLMEQKIVSTRLLLDRENVVDACKKIKELFEIYPDHLKAVGSHMDLFKGKVIAVKDDSLNQLVFFHRQTTVCERGQDAEYVDPKTLNRELRSILKSLKKQKKIISKEDTDHENQFYYEYEF